MVAQTPRRADHDVAAALQRLAFGSRIHAAHTRGDLAARLAIEPGEFALDLQGQFARRRDDQGHRQVGCVETGVVAEQGRGERHAESGCLARAGLGRDQQVAPVGLFRDHGGLDFGEGRIALLLKRSGKRRRNAGIQGHIKLFPVPKCRPNPSMAGFHQCPGKDADRATGRNNQGFSTIAAEKANRASAGRACRCGGEGRRTRSGITLTVIPRSWRSRDPGDLSAWGAW